MKKLSLMFVLALGLCFTGCNDDSDVPANGYIETTQQGSSTVILKGYANSNDGFSVFETEEFTNPFYIQDKKFTGSAWRFVQAGEGALESMTGLPADNAWQETAEVIEGKNYWARYKGATKYTFLKLRVAYIQGNNVAIEYIVDSSKDRDLSENGNANAAVGDNVSVTSYEIPYLNAANHYVAHFVETNGEQMLNYALEWNEEKQHAAWVAFSFDKITAQKNVQRAPDDAWSQDPELPEGIKQPEESNHKSDGYDKGHLCASNDRAYSEEANWQTFYYTNISPQFSSFNQGFWQGLEEQVQQWGASCLSDVYDKLYITKGGTIDNLLINFKGTVAAADSKYPTTDANGFTPKGLACPKYYFMAILAQKGDTYHAIGFWVEHKEDWPKKPTADQLKACAVSIDDLEVNTGLDFFCNLPDVIEDEVESSCNVNDWAW